MKEVLIDTADIDPECFSYQALPQIKQMINNIDYRNVTAEELLTLTFGTNQQRMHTVTPF